MKGWIAICAVFFLIAACGGKSEESGGRTETPKQEESMAAETEGGRILNVNSTQEERVRAAVEHKDEVLDLTGNETATIRTSKGDVEVKFYGAVAPLTVSNFIKLSKLGFYDGLIFHRYVAGFVIQGGDPMDTGYGDSGYTIPLEVDKSAKHVKGALGMARSQDPNSGSCQFYITLAPTPNLDMGYTVFGEVTKGMDVVEKLRQGDKIERIEIHK